MNPDKHILVLLAHPMRRHSRNNARLAEAAHSVPNVVVHDLYEAYPDFDIDVQQEQDLLAASDLIVFQYPIHWYGMPSMMKEWIDTVLEGGWAHGPDGNALHGKDCWLVATVGSPESTYRAGALHGRPFADFLPPLEQTARLCGMRWLPPLIFFDAQQADDAAVNANAERYRQLLVTYPEWAEEAAESTQVAKSPRLMRDFR